MHLVLTLKLLDVNSTSLRLPNVMALFFCTGISILEELLEGNGPNFSLSTSTGHILPDTFKRAHPWYM